MDEPTFEVEGIKIYDPRSNSWEVSDNPALILGHLISCKYIITSIRTDKALDNPFWDRIEDMADICEKEGWKGNCTCAPDQGGPCAFCMEDKHNL